MSKSQTTSQKTTNSNKDHNYAISYPGINGYDGQMVPLFGTMEIHTDAGLTDRQIAQIGLKWFESLIDILPDGARLEVEDTIVSVFRADNKLY